MTQPIVFIPGLLSDQALFAAQTAALSADHTVHVYPSLGDNTIAGIARAILAKAPARFIVGGISMGGYVALEIMRQAPERIEKLILLNTNAKNDSPEQLEKRAALIELAQIGRFKGVTPRLLPLLINEKHLHNKQMTDEIFAMAERIGRDNFVAQQQAIMGRADSRPLLPQIKVPTLIIGGIDDQVSPPELSRQMAELIPNSELHILEDCGHLCTLEQPEKVTDLIRSFITR